MTGDHANTLQLCMARAARPLRAKAHSRLRVLVVLRVAAIRNKSQIPAGKQPDDVAEQVHR